jgi:hypothetical protein
MPKTADSPPIGHSSTLYCKTMTQLGASSRPMAWLDWDLDANRTGVRRRMRDRQQHHETRFGLAAARCNQAGRSILALHTAHNRLARPQVTMPNDKTGSGYCKWHDADLSQQIVKCGVFAIHFRPFNSLDDQRIGVDCWVRALCGCHQPVILASRHQDEFPSAMTRDLDGLALSPMLELTKVALKLEGCCPCHVNLPVPELSRFYV